MVCLVKSDVWVRLVYESWYNQTTLINFSFNITLKSLKVHFLVKKSDHLIVNTTIQTYFVSLTFNRYNNRKQSELLNLKIQHTETITRNTIKKLLKYK